MQLILYLPIEYKKWTNYSVDHTALPSMRLRLH